MTTEYYSIVPKGVQPIVVGCYQWTFDQNRRLAISEGIGENANDVVARPRLPS